MDDYNRTIESVKKDYPNEIEKLEEALLICIGENDLKVSKTQFAGKWNYLSKKLAYPYENCNSIDDYQMLVNNLNNENFFSFLKNKCVSDEEIGRTMEKIKRFNIKSWRRMKRTIL